jgi:osmotically inducible protein OsmC
MAAVIKRKGNAVWMGDLRNGTGQVSSESDVLQKERYTFGTRFEEAPGTNPEELIAAAHAACYSMAFANLLDEKGYDPESIETHATCSLEPLDEGGFAIVKMHLEVRGKVPNIDTAKFQEMAHQADKECPVSNLLRPGLEIELTAELGAF